MPAPWSSELITLRGGLTTPVGVIELGCALEHRGFSFAAVNDKLLVTPPTPTEGLTADERSAVQHWKHHFLAILGSQDQDR